MDGINVTDPLYINLLSQITALNGHTHNGSDSLQLYPNWFHGFPILTTAPTNMAEEGTIELYNDGSTRKLYAMLGGSWRALTFDASTSLIGSIAGDGADGALTFDGSTTILGLVPSGSVYTMTRDIFATTITVNSGVTIKENGFKLSANVSITNNGTIQTNGGNGGTGGNGSGSTAGTGGTGGTGVPSGSLKQPGNGGTGAAGGTGGSPVGGTAASATGNNEPNDLLTANAASGGAGAAGSGTGIGGSAGGPGGTSTGGTATQTTIAAGLFVAANLYNALGGIGCNPQPAGGGGGGGGGSGLSGQQGSGGGGGGGAGACGGLLWICTPSLTIGASGTLSSAGGNGGNGGSAGSTAGSTGGQGGGGGGGNGGLILLLCSTYTNNGSTVITAGTGGTGANSGSTGSAGSIIQLTS